MAIAAVVSNPANAPLKRAIEQIPKVLNNVTLLTKHMFSLV
jgi:hypothetical protein